MDNSPQAALLSELQTAAQFYDSLSKIVMSEDGIASYRKLSVACAEAAERIAALERDAIAMNNQLESLAKLNISLERELDAALRDAARLSSALRTADLFMEGYSVTPAQLDQMMKTMQDVEDSDAARSGAREGTA